ncbi:MAG: hypothetical protein K0R90_248 [Oscillospiraceae bacterium]|nr:hypothetical protein [Oscillospiraceae bacterium]
MNKRIETHVNSLFANTPNGSHVLDIKEELLANLNDKYNDLIISGKSEDEAFALVISGIGDVDNLLKDLGQSPQYQPLEIAKNQQKRGVFISIGIALYVLSIVPVILLEQIGNSNIGIVSMFVICAAATGFIVFGNSISIIKYSKADNSFVEEYKEKVAIDNDRSKLKGAITSSMWSLIVVFYLTISFVTHWWYISWIIFLVGACVQQFIIFVFAKPEKRKNLWHGILWTATTVLYFIISFTTGTWAWSWMIFLMTVAVEQIIRLLILWKKAA